MSNPTSAKGNLAEAAVLADLLRLGYNPMVPWGGNARYDLGVDVDGALIRVQCKSTWVVSEDEVKFKALSNSGWRGNVRRGYEGEADHFGVYIAERNLVLYVPVNTVPLAQVSLFFSQNRLGTRTRLVEKYLKPAF